MVTTVAHAAAADAIAAAQQTPGVVSVGVDGRMHATALEPGTQPSNDTDRSLQWALDRLDAEDLWTQQPGNGTVVAVVDTGSDGNHPDLVGDVIAGTDYVNAGGDGFADGNGHGTHVAGIIAATANNGIGVAGLAQGVKVLAVRVLDDTGSGYDSDVSSGIIYATDHGAAVINLSLGGAESEVVDSAVAYALAHNVVVVAAAGNERLDGNPVSYPAADPGVIGVAASDSTNAIADFSNTGAYVDVTAPGVAIRSTYKSGYAYMSGTSMATPYAAATAALLKAADPGLTPQQVTAAMESTAEDLVTPGRDDESGYGLIDPRAALCAVTTCPATPPSPAPTVATTTRIVDHSRRVGYGARVRVNVRVLDAMRTPVTGAPIRICAGLSSSRSCVTTTTDAAGWARYIFTARSRTTVAATYPGSETTGASASSTVVYAVAPRLRLTRHHRALTVHLSAPSNEVVSVRRWRYGHWVLTDQARVGSGAYTFRALPAGRYRVRVGPQQGLVGTTATVRLR